jgi:hypothetical protein
VIWTVSGFYMTGVHIDTIHGDHFIRHDGPKLLAASQLVSPVMAAKAAGAAETVRLAWLLDKPVYIARSAAGDVLIDARSGGRLPPPTKEQIQRIAQHHFTGPEPLVGLSLIHELPGEIRGRKPPLWRADFAGWNKPTLYISPATGELVSRRHELWRIFDFLWMLHIMDYDERENVNNWLLRSFTVLALLTVLSGAWLLWFAFPRRRKKGDLT